MSEIMQAPERKSNAQRNAIGAIALTAILVIGAGMLHFTYGGNIGFHVLEKEDWSLHDTFVDMEVIENMSVIEALASGHKGVLRALIRDGIIENPLDR